MTELPRKLSLLDATMINVGSMIGSGIFIVPATIALYLQSSVPIILVWVIGGVVSLFGALSVAELGAMMPRAGGQYVYLKETYSPLWGFLYGWSSFAVINTASIAAVAVTFATYMGYFFPMDSLAIKIIAIASIVFLTIINCFGIKVGAVVQNIFTLTKIGALLALALLSFALSGGSVSNFSPLLPSLPFMTLTGPLVLAMVAVLWSYDGWIEITYVAGEVIEPQRNLPRSLAIGTLIVILMYILVSSAVMYVLPIETAAKSQLVLSDTAVKILGTGGAVFISIAVVISTFGTNNGFIFTCPRIYYAMANEGLFFKSLAKIHPKYETPIASLIIQAGLACVLILSGTYNQLITYVVFASFLFYGMSAGAVMILRKRSPGLPRSYKTWGYPFTPVLFMLFALTLTVYSFIENPRDSVIGVGIVLLGVPAYLYWKLRPSLQRIHVVAGLTTLFIFLGTGLYMRLHFPEAYESNESIRFLYRANHIYILFSALINIAIGLNLPHQPLSWKRKLQTAGSLLLMTAPVLLIWAFFTEPTRGTVDRPLTHLGIVLTLLGIIAHLVTRFGAHQNNER